MLDDLKILSDIKPPSEVLNYSKEPFYYRGLLFTPHWRNDFIDSYKSRADNLYLSFNSNGLQISNSWNKFYKGNNYGEYNHSDIKETIYLFESQFGINPKSSVIKKITTGCVIEHNAQDIYPFWNYYLSKRALPMTKNGFIYGSKFQMTDYSIKGYDKTFEVKKSNGVSLPGNFFRLESEVYRMRHFHKRKDIIPIHYVSDLLDSLNIQLLANDLYSKYMKIETNEKIDLVGLSTEDIKTVAVMENPVYRNHIKQTVQRVTWRKYRRKYRDILSNCNERKEVIDQKINSKLIDLVNG